MMTPEISSVAGLQCLYLGAFCRGQPGLGSSVRKAILRGFGCREGFRSARASQRSRRALWPPLRPCTGTMMTGHCDSIGAACNLEVGYRQPTPRFCASHPECSRTECLTWPRESNHSRANRNANRVAAKIVDWISTRASAEAKSGIRSWARHNKMVIIVIILLPRTEALDGPKLSRR